ncbi:hypothetical protein [Xanthomonas sp. 4461]|uniref:hypothetical protein n=1 Tax=Xanthomonas sp. 4461 TaxID=3035313 RepID=UPI002167618B|nr:hypothetical protein [Xanthomonas sp. 4461]MCS3809801.1 hypothetical protein [Xanthomonas sp. 4461]
MADVIRPDHVKRSADQQTLRAAQPEFQAIQSGRQMTAGVQKAKQLDPAALFE